MGRTYSCNNHGVTLTHLRGSLAMPSFATDINSCQVWPWLFHVETGTGAKEECWAQESPSSWSSMVWGRESTRMPPSSSPPASTLVSSSCPTDAELICSSIVSEFLRSHPNVSDYLGSVHWVHASGHCMPAFPLWTIVSLVSHLPSDRNLPHLRPSRT